MFRSRRLRRALVPGVPTPEVIYPTVNAVTDIQLGTAGKSYVDLTYVGNYNSYTETFGTQITINSSYIFVSRTCSIDGIGDGADEGIHVYDKTTEELLHIIPDSTGPGTSAGLAVVFGLQLACNDNLLFVSSLENDGVIFVYDVSVADITNITTPIYYIPNPANTLYAEDNFANFFPTAMKLDGNNLIVRSDNVPRYETTLVEPYSDRVYIYDLTTFPLANPILPASTIIQPIIDSAADTYNISLNRKTLSWSNTELNNTIAINGNRIAIGYPYETVNSFRNAGVVRTYDLSNLSQVEHTFYAIGDNSSGPSDYFGISVDLTASELAISSAGYDYTGPEINSNVDNNIGKIYYYDLNNLEYNNAPTLYYDGCNVYFTNEPALHDASLWFASKYSDFLSIADDTEVSKTYLKTRYDINKLFRDEYVDEGSTFSQPYYVTAIPTYNNKASDTRTEILTVIPMLEHTLNNTNAFGSSANDQFGTSVAVSGDYIVVGVPNEDDNVDNNSGKAYIYSISRNTLVHTLDNPNPVSSSSGDNFGNAVDISGNYVIVGAYNEDSGSEGPYEVGKAYIYDVITGTLLHTLSNPSGSDNDQFGTSVAIHGNYAAVGAPGYQNNSGKVCIFDVATGSLLNTISNPNWVGSGDNDRFGHAIDISGQRMVVGAYNEDTFYQNSGAAYIFDITNKTLLFTLENPNNLGTQENDYFGYDVAISKDIVVVGAPGEDYDYGQVGNESGIAYVFSAINGSLLHILKDNYNGMDHTNAQFGKSVDAYNNYVVIGAPGHIDTNSAPVENAGRAYLYNALSGTLMVEFKNPNTTTALDNNQFGIAVALENNRIVVSSPGESDILESNSGKVYVYKTNCVVPENYSNNSVTRLVDPTGYATLTDDFGFGSSVDISGNYAIIGASWSYDPADPLSVSSTGSGSAHIYDIRTNELINTIYNPNEYGTYTEDSFGSSVVIYNNYAAVSAAAEDDSTGTESGVVYVYKTDTGDWSDVYLLHTLTNPNAYGTSLNDQFGLSIALTDTHLIVGAPREDDATGTDSGKAYIYNVITGSLLYTLDNPNIYNLTDGDEFGNSVAITNNYALIGAYKTDEYGSTDTDGDGTLDTRLVLHPGYGCVYVYDLSTGNLARTIANPDIFPSSNDYFGFSIAADNDRLIVGSYLEDEYSLTSNTPTSGFHSGVAYIFDINTGLPLQQLNNPNASKGYTSYSDHFGWSVDISGNYAIIYAKDEDIVGAFNLGVVYVFDIINGKLVQTLQYPYKYHTSATYDPAAIAIDNNTIVLGYRASVWSRDGLTEISDFAGHAFIYNNVIKTTPLVNTHILRSPIAGGYTYSRFGNRVAMSNNYYLIGAQYEDNAARTNTGYAYLYDSNGNFKYTFTNPGQTVSNEYFGSDVAVSDNYAVVGCRRQYNGAEYAGAAYIYDTATGNLLHTLNNPNAYNSADYDEFGYTVAINNNYVAVSALYESDANGSGGGIVYVFDAGSGSLLYTIENPTVDGTSTSDRFGYSVSMNSTYILISAYYENKLAGEVSNSGVVYLFDITNGNLITTIINPNADSLSAYDYFGKYIDMSEEHIIVSAYGNQQVYLYDFDGTLRHTTDINVYEPDPLLDEQIAIGVALCDNYAIVCTSLSYNDDSYSKNNIRVYDINTWFLLNEFITDNSAGSENPRIAAAGNNFIVGQEEKDALAYGAGEVCVYSKDYNTPTAVQTSVEYNPNLVDRYTNDEFATEVAISGSKAIVSGEYLTSVYGLASGLAAIFDVNTGDLLHTFSGLIDTDSLLDDTFPRLGHSIDISQNYAVISAVDVSYFNVASEYFLTGAGCAFVADINTGTVLYRLDSPVQYDETGSSNMYFGWFVGITDAYTVVTAPNEKWEDSSTGTPKQGVIYVFDTPTGTLLYSITAPDDVGLFAEEINVSDNYIIVSHEDEGYGSTEVGAVYVYDIHTGNEVYRFANPESTVAGSASANAYSNSVAVSDQYAVVGAKFSDVSSYTGVVYVYDMSTGNLLHTLTIDSNATFEVNYIEFGYDVRISGNTIAITSRYSDGNNSTGVLYLYEADTGNYIGKTVSPNASIFHDWFGKSMDIDGSNIIVGAIGTDTNVDNDVGAAYIIDATTLNVTQTLNNPELYTYYGSFEDDEFGNYVAVNSNYTFAASYEGAGYIHMFDNDGGLIHSFTENWRVWDGHSIAASDTYLVVGVPYESSITANWSGRVYVYDIASKNLLYIIENPNPNNAESDGFGYSVDISGTNIIIGTPWYTDDLDAEIGKAHIFDAVTGNLIHTLDNLNTDAASSADRFGYSVAIDGNYAVVGAYREDFAGGNDSGKAYIFDVTTGNFLRYLEASNVSTYNYFGFSVDISGNYAVIGATGEEFAYVYDVTTGNEIFLLQNPNIYSSGTEAGDGYSRHVQISDEYVIVSAEYEFEDIGVVYIYNLATGELLQSIVQADLVDKPIVDVDGRFGRAIAIKNKKLIISASISTYTVNEFYSRSWSGTVYSFNLK